jgi:signal recognition particle subunit SRP54
MQDFLEQIRLIQKMGSLKDLFDKLPFFPGGLPEEVTLDDKELVKIESMINSMTMEERRNPTVFVTTSWEEITSKAGNKAKRRLAGYQPSRVKRIACGSGRKEDEVKELLHKFAMMRQMMVQLGASTGLMGKIPGLKQFQQMKRLSGMDLGALMGGAPGGGAPGVAGGGPMGALGGMGGGMPMMPQSIPGMPKGFTMPGTKSGPPPQMRKGAHNDKKAKRKAEKAARKKARKRK